MATGHDTPRRDTVRDGTVRRDTVRQVVVFLSAIIAIVGAFVGSGAAGGTPIQNAAGRALTADATPIAPAGSAFAIWSVIYLTSRSSRSSRSAASAS